MPTAILLVHNCNYWTAGIVCRARSMKWFVELSLCLSVCPICSLQQNAASLLLWARQVGDIDQLLQQCRVVTGSAMFSVYVDSWTQTHTHTRLMALCPGLPGWAGTRNVKPVGFYWSKRQWLAVASAGPYASLHLARSRQITMPTPHHSVFYRPDALPAAQPTVSKHWRQ